MATDDTIHPHYVHHIYPVILRQHHRTTYRHTIQPIHSDDEHWEDGSVESIVRAPIYREVHHDMTRTDADRLTDARQSLADVGGRRPGKPTTEEIWEEEEHIAEDAGEHEHIVEDVQPVVRRSVRQRHVVHETVPVIEAHHHTKQVEAPTEADAISYNEWLKRTANSQDGDDRQPCSGECSVDADGNDEPQA